MEECEKELIVDGERETFPFFTTACILRFYRIKFFTEGPVPEAAINTADCRKNLSEHIAEEMTKVENALTKLEGEIESKRIQLLLVVTVTLKLETFVCKLFRSIELRY